VVVPRRVRRASRAAYAARDEPAHPRERTVMVIMPPGATARGVTRSSCGVDCHRYVYVHWRVLRLRRQCARSEFHEARMSPPTPFTMTLTGSEWPLHPRSRFWNLVADPSSLADMPENGRVLHTTRRPVDITRWMSHATPPICTIVAGTTGSAGSGMRSCPCIVISCPPPTDPRSGVMRCTQKPPASRGNSSRIAGILAIAPIGPQAKRLQPTEANLPVSHYTDPLPESAKREPRRSFWNTEHTR
jgi:hypothetical protein